MRYVCCLSSIIAAVLATTDAASARQGAIAALTLSPTSAEAGMTVTATATGAPAPCGAVHIDWGDGTAITYATQTLPVTQTHVYKVGGTFTVRARGMGNCKGEATARVTIKGPPPPPPRLTGVLLEPSSATPRTPVAITLEGTGACRVMLDFGDGNRQDIRGTLPASVRHTYALPGRYTIVATPAPPCSERRAATLDVDIRQQQTITALDVEMAAGDPSSVRSITVRGSGRCSYTLDYGDGNSETREAALPDVVRHNYPADGRYTVVATAQPPCSGVQRSTFVVGGDMHGSILRVGVRPQLARVGQPIAVTIEGSGTCRVVVDFDNGDSRTLTARLPHRLTYSYLQPGDYEVVVWAHKPCAGQGDALLRIRRQ